jgi:hypothetical protein
VPGKWRLSNYNVANGNNVTYNYGMTPASPSYAPMNQPSFSGGQPYAAVPNPNQAPPYAYQTPYGQQNQYA